MHMDDPRIRGPGEGMPRLSCIAQPADGALEGCGQRAVQLGVSARRVCADQSLVRFHERVQLQFRRCRLPAMFDMMLPKKEDPLLR